MLVCSYRYQVPKPDILSRAGSLEYHHLCHHAGSLSQSSLHKSCQRRHRIPERIPMCACRVSPVSWPVCIPHTFSWTAAAAPVSLFSLRVKILCRARVRRDGRRAPGGRGTGRLAGGGPQRRSGHSRRRLQGGRAGHRPEGRPRGGAGGQEPDGPKVRDQRRVYAFRLFGWNMPHARTS